jgi:hypothetical protein
MPISTSPYQQNDYKAASEYQPYKLNTQQIAATAMALDQFWKAGAARVKSAYDSVLNLNLTLDENKDLRDKFMEDAQKQLTKLSSGDLANPDVQREGLNIFKPIFQDKAMMQDDHLTNLKSNIFAEADRFKRDLKTQGAGFHMDNLAYALKGFQGFNNKISRNQVDEIYQNAKDSEYVPYYDDTKEKMDIMKLCKGNKLSNMTNNGPYLSTFSDKSLSEAKLYGCLEGALSQRSRQQNRISGSVRYGNDYQAVKQDYIDSASDRKSFYTDQRNKLNAEREAKAKVAGNEDRVAELNSQIGVIDDNIDKLKKDLVTYNSWDDNYMKQNYEDLAANAFFKRSNGAFAQAFATADIESTMKADPIYITHYVQDQLNRRQYAGFLNDVDLENIKFQNKLKLGVDENGNKIGGDNLKRFQLCAQTPGCNLAEFLTQAYKEEATTSGKLEGQINTLNAQKFDIIKDMKNDPTIRKITGDIEIGDATAFNEDNYKKAWGLLNTYIEHADNSDPDKQKIIDVTNRLLEIDNRKTALGGILEDAKNEVSKSNPQIRADFETKSKQILSSTKPVTLFNGQTISAERSASIIAGTDPELHFSRDVIQQYGPGATPSITSYPLYDKEGKQVGWFENNKNVIEKYDFLNNNTQGSYKSILDKYLGESTAVQKMGIATGDLFTKDSQGERDMQTLFGNYLADKDVGEIKFNSVGPIDPTTGKVRIQATGSKSGPISAKDMRDALAKNGVAQSVYPSSPDSQTLEIVLPSFTKILAETPQLKQPLYSDVLRLQLNYLEKKTPTLPPNGIVLQVGKDRDGASYSVKVTKKIGTNSPQYIMIVNKGGKTQEVPFYNTKGMDEKENILIQLDQTLQGLNNQNKQ